jgi:hypothetical protein
MQWKHIKVKPDLHKAIKSQAVEMDIAMERLIDLLLREIFLPASIELDSHCKKCGKPINSFYEYCEEHRFGGGSNDR